MGVPRAPVIQQRARDLRRNPTEAEQRLWRALRQRRFAGHQFRRQQPIGEYIVDFACLERRLIVEVDGAQHAARRMYDARRDDWLRSQRFRVLRFTDREVLTSLGAVEEAIWAALADPPPPPSPARGEGV